ncbi:hypothetical protein [uncultured Brachyspira sp.]|uniref:hypothetical protein n=1 Tax=uncultured Brachyspira sp. TaxID=221953 RepID=UPI002582C64D|nr:hypothetical protein [uncultured Brachyspira sp.]
MIIKVDEENFFSDEYCDKKILVIKEFILIPRLLKLNVGYFDIYMVRDENYKSLFRFGLFDYSYHYVDVPYFYKVCSYLYPDRVPKISENLFEEFVKYAKEGEKRLLEWFNKIK